MAPPPPSSTPHSCEGGEGGRGVLLTGVMLVLPKPSIQQLWREKGGGGIGVKKIHNIILCMYTKINTK